MFEGHVVPSFVLESLAREKVEDGVAFGDKLVLSPLVEKELIGSQKLVRHLDKQKTTLISAR